ncbi:MAG: HupE/UreJ family protein [Deltaproteobacteria bacterium]
MPAFSLLVGLVSLLGQGHVLDVGYLRLSLEGDRLDASLELAAPLAASLSGLASPPEGPPQAGPLLRGTLGSGPMTLGGEPCLWHEPQVSVNGGRVTLAVWAHCGARSGPLSWDAAFLGRAPLSFQLLGRVVMGGKESEILLEPGRETLELTGPRRSFLEFVGMGIRHIGAAPSEWFGPPPRGLHLPDGIDHILFLLALVLGDLALLPVIKAVTGFTLGHSITLALATLGLVRLPPRLTESAIALTIAVVAAEDLFAKKVRDRWFLAVAFGLIHGFGFASALAELQLHGVAMASALVGFNGGVEIGQLIILLGLAPLLWLLHQRPALERRAVTIGSGAILAAASVWFVQRAFL